MGLYITGYIVFFLMVTNYAAQEQYRITFKEVGEIALYSLIWPFFMIINIGYIITSFK